MRLNFFSHLPKKHSRIFKLFMFTGLGLLSFISIAIISSLFYTGEYKNVTSYVNPPTPIPQSQADALAEVVLPTQGYTVPITWGDTGKQLISSGAIDLKKYKNTYSNDKYTELLTFITDSKDEEINVNRDNSYFWVNTLWALGLVQKSDVLDKGIMMQEYGDNIEGLASTGGWTLGSKRAKELYSSVEILQLTPEENKRITQITEGIYRPCCNNSSAFPDCNHGMAILGLVELMVDQGFSDEEIYKAALAFNSYWFPQTYMDLAYYFQTKEGLSWDKVDPKTILGAEFSSASGYSQISKQIGPVPGLSSDGGSCGT